MATRIERAIASSCAVKSNQAPGACVVRTARPLDLRSSLRIGDRRQLLDSSAVDADYKGPLSRTGLLRIPTAFPAALHPSI